MTRKDYVLIAQALKGSKIDRVNPYNNLLQFEQWSLSVHYVADTLQQDNPAFDRSRFLGACGV